MKAYVLFAVVVLSIVSPAVAAGQGTGSRVSVQGALGPLVNTGGNSEAISLGFSPGEHVTLLVSAERVHMPTEVTRTDNSYGATRGGTSTFISGEIHFSPFTFNRALPYGLAGAGRGTARPNVNDVFPDLTSAEPCGSVHACGSCECLLVLPLTTRQPSTPAWGQGGARGGAG